MLTLPDFDRLIRPIRRKILALITRAVLSSVDNSTKTQLLKVDGLAGEVLEDVERIQEFGFDSKPSVDGNAEAILLSLNGNRDINLAIRVHNRMKRPTDLADGESMMYAEDSSGGVTNYIKISPTTNEIKINTVDGNVISIKDSGVTIDDVNGNNFTMTSGKVTINSNLEVLQ